jgi:hypothetical protein
MKSYRRIVPTNPIGNAMNSETEAQMISARICDLAAELLATLLRVEPELENACVNDWANTLGEYWWHADTVDAVNSQSRAWLKVEAGLWRLADDLIALGNQHRGRVLKRLTDEERQRVLHVLGYACED